MTMLFRVSVLCFKLKFSFFGFLDEKCVFFLWKFVSCTQFSSKQLVLQLLNLPPAVAP